PYAVSQEESGKPLRRMSKGILVRLCRSKPYPRPAPLNQTQENAGTCDYVSPRSRTRGARQRHRSVVLAGGLRADKVLKEVVARRSFHGVSEHAYGFTSRRHDKLRAVFRTDREMRGGGYGASFALMAARILRPDGSTPRNAMAPPSMTVSPSTRTLNS